MCGPWMLKAEIVARTGIDLRKYGYRVAGSNTSVLDYTGLDFLSENLVVVGINQRISGNPYFGGAADVDRSSATLIAVDLPSGRIIGPVGVPMLKARDSMKALTGERFAAISARGVLICGSSLDCVSTSILGLSPLLVSPTGGVMAVGGSRRTATKIYDAVTLKELAVYGNGVAGALQTVIPGDKAVFLVQGGQGAMHSLDGSLISGFPSPSGSELPSFRFLGLSYAGVFLSDRPRAVVLGLDGVRKYDYPVNRVDRSRFLTCLDGRRFGIYEHGYTVLNALGHLGDVEDTRPENFARLRVLDLASGVEKASVEWDPLSRTTDPALSPNGSKMARIRGGYLEIVAVH